MEPDKQTFCVSQLNIQRTTTYVSDQNSLDFNIRHSQRTPCKNYSANSTLNDLVKIHIIN